MTKEYYKDPRLAAGVHTILGFGANALHWLNKPTRAVRNHYRYHLRWINEVNNNFTMTKDK